MERRLTTFAQRGEFDKAMRALDELGLDCEVISPDPGYARVGAPALAMDAETRVALAHRDNEFVCSGWVDYRPPQIGVPDGPPPEFEQDVFGYAAIMALAPCVADPTKIRLIAHIAGDLTQVFPYMNAEMQTASYNKNGPTFTFMDWYRMISLYPRRITVAKADEIVDAWRVLEMIRARANETWARRGDVEPSYEMRKKPPVLEILKRLPMTNCKQCGELTCMAFACQVHAGAVSVSGCRLVFGGKHGHLREPLLEICRGLSVNELTGDGLRRRATAALREDRHEDVAPENGRRRR